MVNVGVVVVVSRVMAEDWRASRGCFSVFV